MTHLQPIFRFACEYHAVRLRATVCDYPSEPERSSMSPGVQALIWVSER